MNTDLLTRLRSHIAMMAPHQKDRWGGKLLVEAADELERLGHELALANSRTTTTAQAMVYQSLLNDYEKCKAALAEARTESFPPG